MATVADFLREWHDERPYIVAHTSGSTGRPKEIRLLKSDMLASARATNGFFGISAASTLALPLSVDYIAGKMMAVRAQAAGCRLLELPVSNRICIGERADLLAIVPSQLPGLLSDPDIAAKVGNVIIGGAPLSADAAKSVAASGLRAYATYGMTETCSHVALAPIDGSRLIYQALPGITFRLDGRGCLAIDAPHFSFGSLVTNDVARLHGATFFEWLGRIDNVINSGGLKIHPEQLEREIATIFPTLEFYVVGTPDERWGQAVTMVYEGESLSEAHIRQRLHDCLSDKRTAPRRYVAVTALPRTANGKIHRLTQ